jgi:hypothetical protein
MQDYNYWKHGCIETTIELSCCKYPPSQQLQDLWLENKKALVEYLKKANTGIRGIVRFENGKLAANLTVRINSHEPYFKTNQYGEYYRILLPGHYQLELMFNCTVIYSARFSIDIYALHNNGLVELNITLSNHLFTKYEKIKSGLNKYGLFCVSSANVNANPNDKGQLKCLVNYLTFESLIHMNNNFKLLLIVILLVYFVYVLKSFLRMQSMRKRLIYYI